MNAILENLAARGVVLPETAQDLQPALRGAGIDRTYAILMTGRCGSTWLAAALGQIDGFNTPHEYFSEEAIPHYGSYEEPQSYEQYVAQVARRYGAGDLFGFKTNPNRLFSLASAMDVARTFSTDYCAWIDMRRVNIVKQAFSFMRAIRSGMWHRDAATGQAKGTRANVSDQPITDVEIWQRIILILAEEQAAEAFYAAHGLKPLRLVYEELLDSKWQTLGRVVEHIRPGHLSPDMLDELSDGTEKLSTGVRNFQEERFVCTHAAALNVLNRHRATLDPARVRAWLAAGMTGGLAA